MGVKGSDRVVSDGKFDFHECSSIMIDEETVHQSSKMILRSRKKSKGNLTGGSCSLEQQNIG